MARCPGHPHLPDVANHGKSGEAPHHPPLAGTLDLIEERHGVGAIIDASGKVVESDGSTLRIKEGGAFYAPSTLQCVAVHWPKLVAGTQSGELYHLEVQ